MKRSKTTSSVISLGKPQITVAQRLAAETEFVQKSGELTEVCEVSHLAEATS